MSERRGRESRRFLPGDPRVEEPYRLTPQLALRVAALGFLALGVFAVLFLRLWALQVLSGGKYLAQANDNRVRTSEQDAPRGLIVDRHGNVLVRNTLGTSIDLWPADLPRSPGARAAELARLAAVAGIPVAAIRRQVAEHADLLSPVVVERGIHPDQYAYLEEHQLEFPGVDLQDTYLRQYPHASLAAHLLGYVGEITPSELKALRGQGYQPGDVVGQAGVEATYDKYLRGVPGKAEFTVDSRGRPTSAVAETVLPHAGNTIRLTIDIGVQRAAERALRYGIQVARANGVTYPPGSTWKPVTALAALEEHLLSPTTSLLCSPTFTVAGQTFDNWDPNVDAWIDLPTAIAESCDTFFYQVGYSFYGLPASSGHPLQQWASRFGFGAPTGIDIGPEASGLIPTPEWRCVHYGGPPCAGYVDRIWKPGYSVQLAIGQGDLTVTPIQMARFYAMIANGGELVTPHLVEDVEDPNSGAVLRQFTPPAPEPSGVDPSALRVVQEGLYEATHSPIGTSYGVFGTFPVPIAGKTGTAEKLVQLPGYPSPLKLNQSWWCGYGPVGTPKIVVCAVIENGGHGGTAAAPAALRVFQAYFHRTSTTTVHASD